RPAYRSAHPPTVRSSAHSSSFLLNDPATPEIYPLSLHDALPIYQGTGLSGAPLLTRVDSTIDFTWGGGSPDSNIPSDGFSVRWIDRKSTRLNSSHVKISYAVFCLKKKNTTPRPPSSLAEIHSERS